MIHLFQKTNVFVVTNIPGFALIPTDLRKKPMQRTGNTFGQRQKEEVNKKKLQSEKMRKKI